uniref:Uncharacterized protein n=1 Tax=Felis catus TaxID=9685 RepID=A0ABI7VRP1_FELCA
MATSHPWPFSPYTACSTRGWTETADHPTWPASLPAASAVAAVSPGHHRLTPHLNTHPAGSWRPSTCPTTRWCTCLPSATGPSAPATTPQPHKRIPGYAFAHTKPGLELLSLSHESLCTDGVHGVCFLGLRASLTRPLLDRNQLRAVPRGLGGLRGLRGLRRSHKKIRWGCMPG